MMDRFFHMTPPLENRIMIAIVAPAAAWRPLQSWDPPFKIVWNEDAHTVSPQGASIPGLEVHRGRAGQGAHVGHLR